MKEKINEWSFYQRTLVTLNFLESFTTQKNQPTLLIDRPLKKALVQVYIFNLQVNR